MRSRGTRLHSTFGSRPLGVAFEMLFGIVILNLAPLSASSAMDSSLLATSTSPAAAKPAAAHGRAELFSEGFLYSDATKGQSPGYQVLDVGGEARGSMRALNGVIRARGGVALSDPAAYNYVLVPEAYVTGAESADARTRYTLGRRILPWSELDRQWQLGVWQPRFRWNYFEPETQGLTGLFVEHQARNLEITAFATMLYLPDQGPAYGVQDGRFTSPSPHFSAPATKSTLFNQPTRVRYEVERPAVWSIVKQPAAGAMVRLGGRSGARTQLAYAYKPMNQLLLGVDGYLELGSFDAVVTAHPRVVYHHLASWEAGYSQNGVSGWGGVTREWTLNDVTPSTWTIQQTAHATLLGAGADVDAFRWGAPDPVRVGASVLKRVGGDAQDSGPFANPNTTFFESRYPFKDAVSVTIRAPFPGALGPRLALQTRVLYELNNRSAATIVRLRYQASKAWSLGVGGEFLSSPPEAPTQGFGSDLISRYKSTDRFFGGVSYVF